MTFQHLHNVRLYVGTIPSVTNAIDMCINIGHRFSHQSGLYEGSADKYLSFDLFAFHLYLVFLNMCINHKHPQANMYLSKTDMFERAICFCAFFFLTPAASLLSHTQCLGIPTNMTRQLLLTDMGYNTL